MNKGIYYTTQRVLNASIHRSEYLSDKKPIRSLAQLVFTLESNPQPSSIKRMCCCCK